MHTNALLQELQIDCNRCSGLCCFALYLSKGASFAMEKKAGTPCSHLRKDFCCDCYSSLYHKQMKGCTIYDCFGAGQFVTQNLYKQDTWQSNPSLQQEICNVFPLILQLHQILYYLVVATMLMQAQPYQDDLQDIIQQALDMRFHPSSKEIDSLQIKANVILKNLRDDIKIQYPKAKKITHGIAKDFKRKDLSGYDFTMSILIAANLQGCDVKDANFLGADMRDVNIANTDVSNALFLTQIQLNSAKGNRHTIIPPHLTIPKNWLR